MPCGLGTALFVWWRSVIGVLVSFALLALAAAIAWTTGSGSPGAVAAAWPWLLALEGYGLLTVALVATVKDPRRISRRLLSSFLVSTGAGLIGLALLTSAGTLALGSAVLAGALAFRLGGAPIYAWAPMLLRHPTTRIKALGLLGLGLAAVVLTRVVPLLPERHPAGLAVGVLALPTVPWAGWRSLRQWRSDPLCARTYLLVLVVAIVLLVSAWRMYRS